MGHDRIVPKGRRAVFGGGDGKFAYKVTFIVVCFYGSPQRIQNGRIFLINFNSCINISYVHTFKFWQSLGI
jgi:hypothetical protein